MVCRSFFSFFILIYHKLLYRYLFPILCYIKEIDTRHYISCCYLYMQLVVVDLLCLGKYFLPQYIADVQAVASPACRAFYDETTVVGVGVEGEEIVGGWLMIVNSRGNLIGNGDQHRVAPGRIEYGLGYNIYGAVFYSRY